MFDYIIVGAGSAGCVLANRLSAEGRRVLLLEAGPPDRKREIHIPGAFSKLMRSEVDWDFWTEAEPECDGRPMYWPRGKTLGGSSSINAMLYVRGHRTDYDRWRDLGNPGWGYDDVLPYFRKSENQERGESVHHGVRGPLHVSNQRSINPLSRAFVEAALELGYRLNDDFNGATQEGFGFYQVTQRAGRRQSAADAFLRPAGGRRNLTVQTGALVRRVIIEGGRARAVEYATAEGIARAEAGEIFLCAGTIGSPHLLLLSGIGPQQELAQLGIPVIYDLPGVGRNLQDHLACGLVCSSRQPVSLKGCETLGNLAKWLFAGRGPLTTPVAECGGFVRTRPDSSVPDLQFHFAPVAFIEHGFVKVEPHAFTIGPTLLRPRSAGRIRLKSADPAVAPSIQANYLTCAEDREILYEGLRIARKLARTEAFRPYFDRELFPGDTPLEKYLAARVQTLYHPVGTCKMGVDGMAVVDPQLRVRGIEGLRVVDASVMPQIVGGNTNAPTIMIAERAADYIK
ncbi:MAG: GMC family oxidoreductase N-terminal domain-containing protein [Bryobacterales bacterium]|nr:GMC family oxidoreductase N-terminal domain-containing protein [Bryobacterales bacterium]